MRAAADAAEGNTTLKLRSNVGSFETDEVVIGKVAKPITVSAFAAPQIAYLGQLQPADDITIPEAKDGGIKKQGVKLLLPDGIKFAAKPTVKVP
ncbi:MAG: hypothetical protein H5U00_11105 [Clostridia bacterium]|nr:hypothetical protein [Clostridia bacterium]